MSWEPIAHLCELANPGDFVVIPWRATEEIALMNVEGEITAFDNRCPHRGARIFLQPRGNRPPVCGYHGRCARASQVRRFATITIGGFIFASRTSVGVPAFDERITGFFYHSGMDLRLHSRLEFVMDCDWTVAVENALDTEHVDGVHADSLAKLKLERADLFGFTDGSSLEAFRSRETRLSLMNPVFVRPPAFDYVHAHVFPFACLSSTRGWTYSLQHYFPRADGRTSFIHRLYATPTKIDLSQYFDDVAKLNEKVFLEDAAICAQVPKGFAGNLGPRDDRVARFRSFVR